MDQPPHFSGRYPLSLFSIISCTPVIIIVTKYRVFSSPIAYSANDSLFVVELLGEECPLLLLRLLYTQRLTVRTR